MKRPFHALIAVLFIAAAIALAACGGRSAPETREEKPQGVSVAENGSEVREEQIDKEETETMEICFYIGGDRLTATLADNASARALVALLKEGDLEYTADDYGGFEKVGDIGHTLPRTDENISTKPGDVILYQGKNLCLYYGKNSWNFTRLGRIEGYSESEIRSLLRAGEGPVAVRISLG